MNSLVLFQTKHMRKQVLGSFLQTTEGPVTISKWLLIKKCLIHVTSFKGGGNGLKILLEILFHFRTACSIYKLINCDIQR